MANRTSQAVRQAALRTGLMPTLNTMNGLGLVSIPGMMTGQIVGGSPPLVAADQRTELKMRVLQLAAALDRGQSYNPTSSEAYKERMSTATAVVARLVAASFAPRAPRGRGFGSFLGSAAISAQRARASQVERVVARPRR